MQCKVILILILASILANSASPLGKRSKRRYIYTALGGAIAAKTIALGALGKYAVYKWLTKGTNAGTTVGLELGPVTLGASAGVGAKQRVQDSATTTLTREDFTPYEDIGEDSELETVWLQPGEDWDAI